MLRIFNGDLYEGLALTIGSGSVIEKLHWNSNDTHERITQDTDRVIGIVWGLALGSCVGVLYWRLALKIDSALIPRDLQ